MDRAQRTSVYLAGSLRRFELMPGSRLVLAISGGRDSMVLLHLLQRYFAKDYELLAVHVHHGLRGADADADAALVRDFCESHGVPFRLERLTSEDWAGRGGFEAQARDARYRVLQKVRREIRGDAILTAHHRDDQAETVILRLLRGCGLRGLRGILSWRADKVGRPLLGVSGKRLGLCALELQTPWREDLSNRDPAFRRNAVRHHLLPTLGTVSSPGDWVRLANKALRAQRGLESRLLREWPLPTAEASSWEWSLEKLRGPAGYSELWPSWFKLLLTAARPEDVFDSAPSIRWRPEAQELLRGAILSGRGTVHLGGQWRSEVSAGWLRISGALDPGDGPRPPLNSYLVQTRFFRRGAGPEVPPSPGDFVAYLDADSATEGWELRYRRPGDLFSPPGLCSSSRKLKEYLRECAIPRWRRDSLILLAQGSRVLWIPGMDVSGLHRVTAETLNILELKLACTNKSPSKNSP